MKYKKYIVTVINTVSETSMPYNEFVLYRHNMISMDKQLVIVCSKKIPESIVIPDGLDVICVGNSSKEIIKIMRRVDKECKSKNMKLIVHLHQPKSAIIFHLSTFFKNYRKCTVFTIHSLFNAYNFKNKILSLLSALLSEKVTCVSEASFDHYPRLIKKIKRNNFKVIRNGVDLKRIDGVIPPNVQKGEGIKTLVYVARMIPIKNHKFLIKVFSKLKNCKLILIGAEDQNGEIRKQIESNRLTDRVEILGLIPRNEVFKILKQADIYVSPSLVEGLPISVLEAMYVGLPVVISDIQPHLEIGKYDNNIVTLPLDENEWIKVLNNYLDLDTNSLEKIGIGCRKCALNFSLDAMIKEFDELYEVI